MKLRWKDLDEPHSLATFEMHAVRISLGCCRIVDLKAAGGTTAAASVWAARAFRGDEVE